MSANEIENNEAFVLTLHQKRADKLVNQENSLPMKKLSQKEPKEVGLTEGALWMLFDHRESVEIVDNHRE